MGNVPDIVIRLAESTDADAIAQFGAEVVPLHYEPMLGRDAADEQVTLWWNSERLHAALSDDGLLVAEEQGELVGVAELGTFADDQVLWKLYVRPDRRSQGIGGQLLEAAIGELPHGASRLVLEHFAGNVGAAAFYEREGFVHLRTEPAPSGDPGAATVWRARHFETP